jgi:hypothetical protein
LALNEELLLWSLSLRLPPTLPPLRRRLLCRSSTDAAPRLSSACLSAAAAPPAEMPAMRLLTAATAVSI